MEKTQQEPPYGLKSIHIKDFKGIKKASLEDVPQGTPWIFLTGKNGYGKTCVLQGLFLGWFGKKDGNILIEDSEDFEVILEAHHYQDERIINKKNGDEVHMAFMNIVAYGSSRLNIESSDVGRSLSDGKSSKHYSLFNPDGILLNIQNELKNWYYRSDSKSLSQEQADTLTKIYTQIIHILVRLLPNIERVWVDTISDKVFYQEKNSDQKIEFHQLASGNKSIIAMVGDMVIRLLHLDSNINGREFALKNVNISDIKGTVLIDELDLHLHPEWQKKLPQLLSDIFPKVQFIASTHSPIPFLGAPEGSLFIKVNRTKEEGITIEKLDIDIQNLTPNLILSSPIFGFTEIFPITHQEDERIRTEDTVAEMNATDNLVAELKSYLGSDKEKELEKLLKS